MAQSNLEYDFVISYASEDKAIADELNSALSQGNARVFYAPEYQAELWGENLYEYLADIYSKRGLFFIPLVSKHYISKQWTRHEWKSAQERALLVATKAYILPVRIDDTPLPGLLSTIAYQNIQDSNIQRIAELALEKLKLAKTNVELVAENTSYIDDKGWRYQRQPSQRNTFLQQNNYLDTKSDQFAINNYTRNLVRFDAESEEFISLVAIPVPDAIDFDLDDLPEKLDFNRTPYGKGINDPVRPWLAFNIHQLTRRFSASKDLIRYEYTNQRNDGSSFVTSRYMRFSEDGAIEYAVGDYITYPVKDKRVFNFIYIVGLFWKFVSFASYSYDRLGYLGTCQIMINLHNTQNSLLGSFASDQQGKEWSSAVSNGHIGFKFLSEGQGQTIDQNLQFVFEFSVKKIHMAPEISQDIMVDLSKKLQRSYNYQYDQRHFIRGTEAFPWGQYSQMGEE